MRSGSLGRRALAAQVLFAGLAPTPARAARVVEVEVLATYPHATDAYTQGLVYHQGSLYESTGEYGTSSLREVNPQSGEVLRQTPLPANLFGEGLALVGGQLIQLTWREQVALVWSLSSFTETDRQSYTGEGWGLCFDGARLVMSNGTSRLQFRDPADFTLQGSVEVTLDGSPLTRLNELECVAGRVLANVWYTSSIVEIDPVSGHVLTVLNAPNLVPRQRNPDAVLNGIAFDPQSGHFFITGKLWPSLFEVRFPGVPSADPTPTDDGAPAPAAPRRASGLTSSCSAGPASLWAALVLLSRRRRRSRG